MEEILQWQKATWNLKPTSEDLQCDRNWFEGALSDGAMKPGRESGKVISVSFEESLPSGNEKTGAATEGLLGSI